MDITLKINSKVTAVLTNRKYKARDIRFYNPQLIIAVKQLESNRKIKKLFSSMAAEGLITGYNREKGKKICFLFKKEKFILNIIRLLESRGLKIEQVG
jgi:hypothetical protein